MYTVFASLLAAVVRQRRRARLYAVCIFPLWKCHASRGEPISKVFIEQQLFAEQNNPWFRINLHRDKVRKVDGPGEQHVEAEGGDLVVVVAMNLLCVLGMLVRAGAGVFMRIGSFVVCSFGGGRNWRGGKGRVVSMRLSVRSLGRMWGVWGGWRVRREGRQEGQRLWVRLEGLKRRRAEKLERLKERAERFRSARSCHLAGYETAEEGEAEGFETAEEG